MMVEKIEVGKRYRVDLSKLKQRPDIAENIKKYSDNGVILISAIVTINSDNNYWGKCIFKKDDGVVYFWLFKKEELLPIREEAFLEIFKEEIYGR